MGEDLFTNAIIKLSSEMGSLRTAIENQSSMQAHAEDRWEKGRERNIQAQKEIKTSIDKVASELRYKMDEREYKFIVLMNMMVKNWKMSLIIFGLMAASATAAKNWDAIAGVLK